MKSIEESAQSKTKAELIAALLALQMHNFVLKNNNSNLVKNWPV